MAERGACSLDESWNDWDALDRKMSQTKFIAYIEQQPEAGYINENDVYVLPADWYNEEDDVYERFDIISLS